MNDDTSTEIQQEAPPVDTSAMDSIVSEPSPEVPAEIGSGATEENVTVAPSDEQPPAAAVVTPGPDGVVAETPVLEEEEILPPSQRADGKWTDGKYVADSIEQLFVQVKKGQREAEKLIGKKAAADPTANPFIETDDDEFEDDDELEVFDEADLVAVNAEAIGRGLAQQLAAQGLIPAQQPVDNDAARIQALQFAQQAIDSENTSADDFRAVLHSLVLNDPENAAARQVILEEWADRPGQSIAAAQEAARIETAFQQHLAAQGQQHQLQQAQAAYEAEQAQLDAVTQAETAVTEAYTAAQHAFVERNPGWEQHNDVMNAWMAANGPLMATAKGNPAAVYQVFQSALQYAQAVAGSAGGAGIGGRVSEQGGNMGNVIPNGQVIDPAVAAQQVVAQQRGFAGLETGAAVDDVNVTVMNPNPPGLAETPIGDLIGMEFVG